MDKKLSNKPVTEKDKLRKNWAVEIQDDNWRHRTNNASVPGYALIKRNFA